MKEEGQKEKPQQTTTLQKITTKLYFVFCGSDDIDPIINRSIVSNTYQQIIEILHFTLLYTVFGKTQNATYDIIQTILSSCIIVVCLIPRFMDKYYFLMFTLLAFIVITLASASAMVIIIINYYTFTGYCDVLQAYKNQNAEFIFQAAPLCVSIINLYRMQLVFGGFMEFFRVIYIYFIVKAYKASKKKYNEQEKKRRRQEKFDENMKNKSTLNLNRKI